MSAYILESSDIVLTATAVGAGPSERLWDGRRHTDDTDDEYQHQVNVSTLFPACPVGCRSLGTRWILILPGKNEPVLGKCVNPF